MNKKIFLISCVSQKRSQRAAAQDLYTSTLFTLNMRYARQLKPDAIFILSAKHGLLAPETMIDPYDVTLNEMSAPKRRQWAERVRDQLTACADLEHDHFIFLAGNNYRKHLLPHIRHYDVPLVGLRIGEQLGRLKALTA